MRIIPMLMQASNDLVRRGRRPLDFEEMLFIVGGIYGEDFMRSWEKQMLAEVAEGKR